MVPLHVCVVGCRREVDGDPRDVYPDPDNELLLPALLDAGATADVRTWDDPTVAWDRYDAVVLRSSWDSVDRPDEFMAWADRTDEVTRLLNPAAVVGWNLHKRYLAELAAAGIPIVPTDWVEPDDAWRPPDHPFVVKPAVSAGGRRTARYTLEELDRATAHVRELQDDGLTVMVQPFVDAVDEAGESKLVFIGGAFSHAFGVRALLRPGEAAPEQPWLIDTQPRRVEPDAAQLDVAQQVLMELDARFAAPLTYARVDLVPGPSSPLVLEIELIDPMLMLSFRAEAPAALAAAIAAAARG